MIPDALNHSTEYVSSPKRILEDYMNLLIQSLSSLQKLHILWGALLGPVSVIIITLWDEQF